MPEMITEGNKEATLVSRGATQHLVDMANSVRTMAASPELEGREGKAVPGSLLPLHDSNADGDDAEDEEATEEEY
jgi:hypothetical protein